MASLRWYIAFLNALQAGTGWDGAVWRADQIWINTSTPEEKREFVAGLLREIAQEDRLAQC